nr:hypothetical protein [Tanacetum cinerariifolium]
MDHQKRVEVEDPKIVATRERNTRAAAKKRERKRQEPLQTINPTDPSRIIDETAKSQEDRSPHVSPHGSANHFVHNYSDTHVNKETDTLQLGTFGDQSGRVNFEVGESSSIGSLYVPDWSIHQRCRLDTLMWCRELMVHLVPQTTQEESNALTNDTALERAWFSLPRGALVKLTSSRGLSVSKLILTTLSDRYKAVKKLEEELARKDSALVYAKILNAERAQDREKLVTQLSKTKMEKFHCVCKLLPIVVERLLQSHEYKQSLFKPFNLAIQARWGKGLGEERSEEDLLELMSKMKNFDVYADKKMCVEYDKLFEKRYPYVENISRGFCHPVFDLLKVYPDSPPSRQAPPS